MGWFTREKDSATRRVMDVTNEVMTPEWFKNAAIPSQMQNMGVSNKAELRHLMTLFAVPRPSRDAQGSRPWYSGAHVRALYRKRSVRQSAST